MTTEADEPNPTGDQTSDPAQPDDDDRTDPMGIDDDDPIDATLVGSPVETADEDQATEAPS